MYAENHVLIKNIFANGLNMGLSHRASVEETFHRVETHWLSDKEKVNKEGHADSVLGYERNHHYRFPWKSATLNVFPIVESFVKIHLIYWMTLVYLSWRLLFNVYVYVFIQLYICIYMCACVCVYIYIYIYI